MTKKEEKQKHPEWFKDGHKTLMDNESPKVQALFRYYEKDRYLARVMYTNNPSGHENYKVMLFTKKNGHFSIVFFRRKFGISVTNKIYSHEKRLLTITYNGKFWLMTNNRRKNITQATLNNIVSSIPHFGVGESTIAEIILDKLQERFTWLRFMREHEVLQGVAFNTIIRGKIYSLKKALKHEYKVTLPVAKLLNKYKKSVFFISKFKDYLKYIDNVESLKEEWFNNNAFSHIFHDSLRLAKILDKKVNCSWTTRRLKEEHDNWSKTLTDIIFIDGDRPMRIHNIFTKFQKFSGYEMLETTKEMAYEGKRQNHCVSSYVDKVENGNCAIFRIKDFTLEVIWGYSNGEKMITIGQLRGYSNVDAPKYLEDEVLSKIVEFNNKELKVVVSKEQLLNYNSFAPVARRRVENYIINDELPF